jgi:hypothetical protein
MDECQTHDSVFGQALAVQASIFLAWRFCAPRHATVMNER